MIRRYVLPGVLAAGTYLLLGAVFPVRRLYIAGLLITVLTAYFIRVCDDISDHERDAQSGKAPIGKKALIAMAVALSAVLAGIALYFALYLTVLPLFVIAAQFLLKEKYRDLIKPLFIPVILITLFCTVFAYSHFVWIPIAAVVILDTLLILKKRCFR